MILNGKDLIVMSEIRTDKRNNAQAWHNAQPLQAHKVASQGWVRRIIGRGGRE